MRLSGSGFLWLGFLFQLFPDPIPLQPGKVVDKDLAIEMIHFMLDTDRQYLIGLCFEGVPIYIHGIDPDLAGSLNRGIDAWHGQASLFYFNYPLVEVGNLRIDEHLEVIPGF